MVDGLEEFVVVLDFDEGQTFGAGGGDPDGGGVLDSDALAEGEVGFDGGGEGALRVEGEGELDVVAGGEFLGELLQNVEGGDGGLVGEDLIAVLVAEGFGFGVEPAGVDGGLSAPRVVGEREVVADEGDVVLHGGLADDGVDVAADGALHVFKLDDGYAGSGGRLDGRGVVDLGERRSGGWTPELGLRGGGGENRQGESGFREGKHRGWTLSSL